MSDFLSAKVSGTPVKQKLTAVSDALELSDENVDGGDNENVYSSKAVLVPEPKSNDDLKNTLKGDELFEVINPEGILTEIPDDFIENSEVDLNSELDQNSDRNSKIDSEFDQDSEVDTSDHLSILESDFEAPEEIPQEIDPNLGVTKIKWRITRTLKPKPPPPPPPRIESSNFESIQFDPSIYGGENFESENERQKADNLNQTLETMISESEKSEDYTVDVDDSILEEESVLYTKPYIKLRVDWMW